VIEDRPGLLVFRAVGPTADALFAGEDGGHRWQRVPPTERHGRVHSSSVTVAVLPEPTGAQVRLDPADLEVSTCRGSGAGGQHRNKTESAVIVRHRPTGLTVRVESERSQHQNRETAMAALRARLLDRERGAQEARQAADRRQQVGSGQRGDKRRTVAVQRDSVVDHRTGRRTTVARYVEGHLEDLIPGR
jgi:peptide chain release factor 1